MASRRSRSATTGSFGFRFSGRFRSTPRRILVPSPLLSTAGRTWTLVLRVLHRSARERGSLLSREEILNSAQCQPPSTWAAAVRLTVTAVLSAPFRPPSRSRTLADGSDRTANAVWFGRYNEVRA